MQPTITARHCEVSEPLRQRAVSVVQRLEALASRPMESTVVFDTDGTNPTVEIRLHLARGEVLVASGSGVDHRTALDRAEEKLRRQVTRASERPHRMRSTQSDNTR